ncbi:hypothetical protein BHE74_00034105 [Ensete ventricosum]|nr:hypothetical protein BHE74_00034105 [Ensete ventricosum]
MPSGSRRPRYVPQRGHVLRRMIKRLLLCFFPSDPPPPREKETQKGKRRSSSCSLHSMVS